MSGAGFETADYDVFNLSHNGGCANELALNYNNESNVDDGTCEYDFTDLNGDGDVNILDILYIVNSILLTP